MKRKNLFRFAFVCFMLLLILFLSRFALARGAGQFLIHEDDFDYVEVGFVLSGQAYDRGREASVLLKEEKVGRMMCTGANQSPDLAVFGSNLLESDLTKMRVDSLTNGVFTVELLQAGTSTFEESEAILAYCKQHKIDSCLIITSMFHTKRVKSVFAQKFKEQDIEVLIKGAASSAYEENEWWTNEYGLIALNNEYIKLLYYQLKY